MAEGPGTGLPTGLVVPEGGSGASVEEEEDEGELERGDVRHDLLDFRGGMLQHASSTL